MRRSVVRPKLVSKKWTSGMRISRNVMDSIFIALRYCIVANTGFCKTNAASGFPLAQQERAVAMRIARICDHAQPLTECLLEALAIPALQVTGLGACLLFRLPLIDRLRYLDALQHFGNVIAVLLQELLNAFRLEPPLGHQTVGRQTTLQRR